MSKIVKDHILALLKKNLRGDGREKLEYRNISIEHGISAKSAEGSARVKIGDTEVVAGVKLEVGEPFPDTPDEGVLMVNAELIPLSNPDFESGPPGIDSVELSRVVDRGIRESKCVDFEKLCVKSKEKVWMVNIDIYPINDAGNLFDAAALAAFSALKDAKFPEYDIKEDKMNYEKKTSKGLPIKEIPAGVTVVKLGDNFLVDPSYEEWTNLDARLTVVSTEDGTICAMQKGGEAPLTINDVEKMIEIGVEKGKELRKKLK